VAIVEDLLLIGKAEESKKDGSMGELAGVPLAKLELAFGISWRPLSSVSALRRAWPLTA